MAERVQTGGLMRFDYRRGEKKELDEERKQGIKEGYAKYYERKEREKKRRNILIIALVLIVIVIAILFFVF